jgi:hypothetical protein
MGSSQSRTAEAQARLRRPIGILWLALANLVVASAVVAAFPNAVRGYFWPILHFNIGIAIVATLRGQALVLGMVGGLLPKRAIAGLAAVLFYAIVNGYGLYAVAATLHDESGIESTAFWFCVWAIAGQIAFRIARLCDGWQLSSEPPTANHRPRQYEIVDLMELTAAVAVALGLYIAVRGNQATSETIRVLCHAVAEMLLVGLPVALLILAAPNPGRWTLVGVMIWCVVAEMAMWLIWNWSAKGIIRLQFPQGHSPYMPMFLGVIAANSLVLRRLGYRCWRR